MRSPRIRILARIAGLGCIFGVSVCLGAGSSRSALIEPGLGVGQVRVGEKLEEEDKDWEQSLPPSPDKSPKEGLVDQVAGIAFEFRAGARVNADKRGYCLAIHVFRPGTTPRPIGSFDE